MKDDDRDAYYREASDSLRENAYDDARREREFREAIADREAACVASGTFNPAAGIDVSANIAPNNTTWLWARGD